LTARLVAPVVPARASAGGPAVPAPVRALAARGRHRVAVASCFAAPGRFATECARTAPWIASAPLGTHPALARLLLHRYDEALAPPAVRPPYGTRTGLKRAARSRSPAVVGPTGRFARSHAPHGPRPRTVTAPHGPRPRTVPAPSAPRSGAQPPFRPARGAALEAPCRCAVRRARRPPALVSPPRSTSRAPP